MQRLSWCYWLRNALVPAILQLCFNFSWPLPNMLFTAVPLSGSLLDFPNWLFLLLLFLFICQHSHPLVSAWLEDCFQYRIFRGLVFTHLSCFPHLVCDFSQGGLVSHHRLKVNTLLTQFLTLTGRMSLSIHKFVFRWATAKRAANHVIPLLLNMSDRRTVP